MTFLSVLAGAIMTAIIGNWLVQRWQQNNWVLQQRQSLKKTEIDEIKSLASDIHSITSRRIFYTRRALHDFRDSSTRFSKSLDNYSQSVLEWNQELGNIYSRISLLLSYSDSIFFEKSVHEKFVIASRVLDICIRSQQPKTLEPRFVRFISSQMDEINGQVIDFNRDLLRKTRETREFLLNGRVIHYDRWSLNEFSTLELATLLFTKNIDTPYVTRSF